MDNEFMNTPLLASPNQRRGDSSRRDELIKALQLKNNKLKTEIYKIKEVIQEKFSSVQQEPAKKRQSLLKFDQSPEVLQKELANAYKRIKMYQYQIGKIENGQGTTSLTQKASQIDNIIKQKRGLTDKLRTQIHKEQRTVNENTKKLANNHKQHQIERQMKSLTDQIKFLKEKLKDLEQKGQMKQKNLKKQYEFVQKLQNQLLQAGVSHSELEELKMKIMKKNNPNMTHRTDESAKFASMGKTHIKEEEQIEDRTIDRYKTIQSEVRLLEKMQGDYQKQIAVLEEDKKTAMQKNFDSRNRLIERENEIETLEKEISELKGKVISSNMKPLKPLRSLSSHTSAQTKPRLNTSAISKSIKELPHLLKFDQVGIASDKGQRFTDRNILGKSNLNTRIIGMNAFLDKSQGTIWGFQFVYLGNKKGGQYVRKDRESREKAYNEVKFLCQEGDCIKSINGTLDNNDRLESVSFITRKMQTHKVGNASTFKKAFNFDIGPDQAPVCVFGSLVVFKEPGKKEFSAIEHFGVQINRQTQSENDRMDPTIEDPEFE